MAIIVTEEEHERAVLRSRRMYQSDLESNLATAEDRGRKEGRIEGRIEGKIEGRKEEKRDLARRLLSFGLPINQIALYTELTESEIRSLLS